MIVSKWREHVSDKEFYFGKQHVYMPKPEIRVFEIASGATGVVVPGNYVVRFGSVAEAKQYVEAIAQLGD